MFTLIIKIGRATTLFDSLSANCHKHNAAIKCNAVSKMPLKTQLSATLVTSDLQNGMFANKSQLNT